jgi:hypothetical protein
VAAGDAFVIRQGQEETMEPVQISAQVIHETPQPPLEILEQGGEGFL